MNVLSNCATLSTVMMTLEKSIFCSLSIVKLFYTSLGSVLDPHHIGPQPEKQNQKLQANSRYAWPFWYKGDRKSHGLVYIELPFLYSHQVLDIQAIFQNYHSNSRTSLRGHLSTQVTSLIKSWWESSKKTPLCNI